MYVIKTETTLQLKLKESSQNLRTGRSTSLNKTTWLYRNMVTNKFDVSFIHKENFATHKVCVNVCKCIER